MSVVSLTESGKIAYNGPNIVVELHDEGKMGGEGGDWKGNRLFFALSRLKKH